MRALRFVACALLAVLGAGMDLDLPEDRAFLLIHSSIAEDPVVAGRNITVSIQVFNAGTSAAFDVELEQQTPPGAPILEGETSAELGRLGAGQNVTHTYVMSASEPGTIVVGPASVKYRATEEDSAVTFGAVPGKQVGVVGAAEHYASMGLKAGAYATLGFVQTAEEWKTCLSVGGAVAALGAGSWFVTTLRARLDDRRRRRAIEALEKDE
mmetsp:Transcript_24386/g.83364  ORF Transcript_24386/g.83364 Transcript_24386/m.83364 type:complete len:211 (-) Transcript_24386:179-811(-)